jgi:hypothetical protein
MISTDGISDEQKATVKFQAAYADMMGKLTAPGFIAALCAHEGAHLVYYEMMGPIRYESLPPRLEYSPEKQAFTGHFAAIKLAEEPLCEPHKWQEYVTMMAHAHAAGGVVARKLLPTCSGGDEVDKENFSKLCTDLINHFGGISIDVELCWKRAQDAVKRQLEDDPHIMEMIQQRALELRPLFGFIME